MTIWAVVFTIALSFEVFNHFNDLTVDFSNRNNENVSI